MPGYSKTTGPVTDTNGNQVSCPSDGRTDLTTTVTPIGSSVTCAAGHNVDLPNGTTPQDVINAAYRSGR